MKTDRRVLKTEQALESALLKLMRGKSIDQITTTELCREAGINRNTFYAHYPNPTSLLERVEDEFIKVIVGIIDDTVKDQGYSMLLQRVFEAIIEHKALSLVLLSRNGDPNYLRRIIETARVPVIEYWRGLGTELSQDAAGVVQPDGHFDGAPRELFRIQLRDLQAGDVQIAGNLCHKGKFAILHIILDIVDVRFLFVSVQSQ